jgi:hypothetical protein
MLITQNCAKEMQKRLRRFISVLVFAGIVFIVSIIFSTTESIIQYTYYIFFIGCVILIIALCLMIPWKANPIDITEPMTESHHPAQSSPPDPPSQQSNHDSHNPNQPNPPPGYG